MFSRLKYDDCNEFDQDRLNEHYYIHNQFPPAYWRPGTCRVQSLSLGVQPDFYGPITGLRVQQEAYLQGRGQMESNCAGCEVRYLPTQLFPGCACGRSPCQCRSPCQRTDLQPLQTRERRSCNDLSETDASVFQFFPENFQTGYLGANAIVPQYHGRLLREIPRPCCGPRTSFGRYETAILSPYS